MGPATTSNIRPNGDTSGVTLPAQPGHARAVREVRPVEQVTVPSGASQEQAAETLEALRQAVKEGNEALRQLSTDVEFSMDDDTGRVVVRVVDSNTKEVLRQIPSKEMLAIARAIDKLQGLLIEQEA